MAELAGSLQQIIASLEEKYGPKSTWTSTAPPGSATPRCLRCRDQGWTLTAEPNPAASVPRFRAVPCTACSGDDDGADQAERLWRLSGVSDQERQRCSLATWRTGVNRAMDDAFAAVADWGQGRGKPFLLLFGPTRGIGKTHLAIAAVGESIARGVAA